jgi:hypothetical protein
VGTPELIDPHEDSHALGEVPAVVAEEYLDGVMLVVACEVDVGGDIALLQSGV